jgi:predicted CopG family antitoxin
MGENTTIGISKDTKELLDKAKQHPRETYEDVIVRLLKLAGKEAGSDS